MLKKIVLGATVASFTALAGFVAPAAAWEGSVVACYDKVQKPATYSYTKSLEYKAVTKWEHRKGQLVKVYYQPVYLQKKTLKRPAHILLVQGACR